MKIWNTPVIDELDIEMTANGVIHADIEYESSDGDSLYCSVNA